MKELNILLTSVGRRSYLVEYFKEALNGTGKIHVANSSELSPALQVADKAVVTPLIYNGEYIPFLKKYCVENNITAIISLFDIDLPILSKHKDEFKEIGITVIVSNYSAIEVCNDKWKTYQFLVKNGINTPKTYISVDVALDGIASGKIAYPLMVKPRWGMGSIAVFEAENEEELRIFYKKTMRNIEKTYLKYESAEDIEQSVLIQEKLLGQEYGLDVINNLDGNYVNTIAKMKYAMRSGETDCAVTVDKIELKKLGEKLSKTLRHIANLDIDVFIVGDKCYVLEMNARFGGGYPFSHMAGVNLPLAIVKWLRGECVEQELLTERINVMSQKDISLVRLYLSSKHEIKSISNLSDIQFLIKKFEKLINPTLTERGIDLDAYSEKICEHGRLLAAINQDGEYMGILAAYMNDVEKKTAYLTFLAVESKYRELKIGKELLQFAENEAKKCGMYEFLLEVRSINYNAIGFYKSHGYNIVDNASEKSYHMKKDLE